jgi:hypothetical protein
MSTHSQYYQPQASGEGLGCTGTDAEVQSEEIGDCRPSRVVVGLHRPLLLHHRGGRDRRRHRLSPPMAPVHLRRALVAGERCDSPAPTRGGGFRLGEQTCHVLSLCERGS